MAFTESLLLRKGHFLSRKEGVYSRNTFFVLKQPRKKGTFFTFKKVGGGAHAPPPPPVPRPLRLITAYFARFLPYFAKMATHIYRAPSRDPRNEVGKIRSHCSAVSRALSLSSSAQSFEIKYSSSKTKIH
jgi:hypothetical protein